MRWLRWLRRFASAAMLALAVAIVGVWTHSYTAWSEINYRDSRRYEAWLIVWGGWIDLNECGHPEAAAGVGRWAFTSRSRSEQLDVFERGPSDNEPYRPGAFKFNPVRRFGTNPAGRRYYSRTVVLPCLPLALAVASVGMLLRPKPRWRFGLREALVATRVLCVVLGVLGSLGGAGGR